MNWSEKWGTPPQDATNLKREWSYSSLLITRNEVISGLSALGFEYLECVPEQGSARIPARGKPARNRSASILYRDDGTGCIWYEFTSGDGGAIFSCSRNHSNATELYRRNQVEADSCKVEEAERERKQQRVATQAQAIYRDGETVGTHPYIEEKQLSGLHNGRIERDTGALVIPMWVSGIGLVNIQRIHLDGSKRYLYGGRVKCAYSVIGSLHRAKKAVVAEGWATGATLHESVGLPVVVSFSAGNLLAVCEALRARFPDLLVIVASDDDRQTQGNPGRVKAVEAAEAIGGMLTIPSLCKCCTCSDYNDIFVCERRCGRG